MSKTTYPVYVAHPPRFKRAYERKFDSAVPVRTDLPGMDLDALPVLNPKAAQRIMNYSSQLEKVTVLRNPDEMIAPKYDYFYWNQEVDYFFPTVHPAPRQKRKYKQAED